MKSRERMLQRLLGKPTVAPTYYLSIVRSLFGTRVVDAGDNCKNDNWNVPPDDRNRYLRRREGSCQTTDLGLICLTSKSRALRRCTGIFYLYNAEKGSQ